MQTGERTIRPSLQWAVIDSDSTQIKRPPLSQDSWSFLPAVTSTRPMVGSFAQEQSSYSLRISTGTNGCSNRPSAASR